MKKRKKSGAVRIKAYSTAKSVTAGVLSGIIIWVILLVAASFIIADTAEPEKLIMPAVFMLAALSSALAGFVSAKASGTKSISPGIITGAVLLFIVWGISLAVSGKNNDVSLALRIILCFDFMFFALIGGLFGRKNGSYRRRTGK